MSQNILDFILDSPFFKSNYWALYLITKTKKLHGLSPRANYTDRATAACRGGDCQLLWIEVVSVTDPYGRVLGFLDKIRCFSIK
jgi:hypothetical protein